MTEIRVVIADDQAVVREGLVSLLGMVDGLSVVGSAASGTAAVAAAAQHRPDVVLMDLRMPDLDGAGATEQIIAQLPGTAVLVLTTFADDESIMSALRAGARGYLTKDADITVIEQAIRAVHAGQTLLAPEVHAKLLTALGGSPAKAAPLAGMGLTERELEVLTLIAAGQSNGEIAAALFVSAATVKTHVNHLFAKLGVRDRAQAMSLAHDAGLS